MVVAVISPHAQTEITAVDPTKTLAYTIDTDTYGEIEFSYSGLDITGGSALACEHGASELLEQMGFRFYSSAPWGTVRPATINTGLSRPKGSFWMPYNRLFLVYGHAWQPPWTVPDNTTLRTRQIRWQVLNGLNQDMYPAGHRWSGNIDNKTVAGSGGTTAHGSENWYRNFFFANPQLIRGGFAKASAIGADGDVVGAATHFDLDPTHISPADMDKLVTYNAAVMLAEGHKPVVNPAAPSVNEVAFKDFHRTHFDASDGDFENDSDMFFTFTEAVAQKMRTGTPAVNWPGGTHADGTTWPAGSIPAQTAEPLMQLGCYAYAGHKLPPTEVMEAVYVQVNTAYNGTGFTLQELVAGHKAKATAVMLREYWSTTNVSHGKPFINRRMKPDSFNIYDDFVTLGAVGMNTEFDACWLTNMVGVRYAIRKMRTGLGTWDDALDDIMQNLFSPGGVEDPAVRDLLTFWSAHRNKYNRYNLRRCFDFTAAMSETGTTPNGTLYKEELFERYLTILKKEEYLPVQIKKADNVKIFDAAGKVVHPGWPTPRPGDLFPAAIADYAADIVGTRMDEILHGHAQLRHDCNGKISTNYPDYWMYRLRIPPYSPDPDGTITGTPIPPYTSYPDWYLNPTVPSRQEFTDAHAILLAETPHDLDYDSEDLVLVRGVQPTVPLGVDEAPEAPGFNTRYGPSLAFLGPGTIIYESKHPDTLGDITSETYGSGLHFIDVINGYFMISHVGGELFTDTFGGFYHEPHTGGGYHWLYVPQRAVDTGTVMFEADARWTFYDRDGNGVVYRLDLMPKNHVAYISPENLGPGQIKVDNGNSRGSLNNPSANRWLSRKRSLALMPRIIADEEFPNMAKIHVAP